ncbi:hypothetical protein CGLO_12263 [Colletotrichum gloeosporioides Cg-14]|uniref:Uncharacterized protein n=1 Tax=Colletotrichum gloeosporioides (strain Cg-14) TaxID=1237896 RepID=T0LA09_COLGC|nr:hypothetical protein CGLO_12263 [Colletotrichum gloeosporioides Cg-14]
MSFFKKYTVPVYL